MSVVISPSPMCSKSSQLYHRVFNFLVAIILAFIFLRLTFYHFKLITYEFPLGFREGAILLNTQLILNGGNPYDFEKQPLYTNVYGIFYHLAIYPFTKVFNEPLVLLHRAFTGCYIVASTIVVFLVARFSKASYFLSLSGALIFYAHLLTQGTPLASPDSLGLFLFLSSIFIPHRFQYSSLSLLISIFLGVLGFLTKPYFVIGLVYLTLYLLITSGKKAIQYSIGCILALGSSILLMNYYYETYFNNTFFIHVGIATNTPGYVIKQLLFYGGQNFPIIAIVLLSVFSQLPIPLIFSQSIWQSYGRKGDIKLSKILHLTRQLFQSSSGLSAFCLVLSLAIFCLKTGQHEGNWQVYIHHLISPFLILLAIAIVGKIPKKIGVTFFLINLLIVTSVFPIKLNYETRNWEVINSLISGYQNIYNSPAIVQLLMQQDKKIYDGGQSEYLGFGAYRKLFGILLPSDPKVKLRDDQYKQELVTSVQQKQFDLVLLTKEYPSIVPKELVEQYYTYQKTLNADMPVRSTIDQWRQWNLDVYLPK